MKQRLYTLLAWLALGVALMAQRPLNMLGTDPTTGRINFGITLGSGKAITAESGASVILSSGSTLNFFGASVTNEAGMRTALSLVPGTDVQIHDPDLTTLASSTAAFLSLANDATIPAIRDTLGASSGVWPPSLGGTGIDTSATAVDRFLYTNGTGSWTPAVVTTFARSQLDDADATAGRASLELGSIATQASNNVTITGGSVTGITDITVADGGTGASAADTARAALKSKDRRTILVVGNSISTSAPTTVWPTHFERMADYIDDDVINSAVGGQELNALLVAYSTTVTPYIPATTKQPLVVILPAAAGADVYNGTSAATAWGRIQTFAGLVHADGGKLVVGTVPPGSLFNGDAPAEARRVALNALILAGRADYDWLWPMHALYPVTSAAFYGADDQHGSDFGHVIMARDARLALTGFFDSTQLLPSTMTMTNGLALLKNDNSTAGITLSADGGITVADEVTLAPVTGGFASGGIWFDANSRMGILSNGLYLRMPTDGIHFYTSATGQAAILTDAGMFGTVSLKVGGVNGGSGTEIKSIKHATAVLVAGAVTVTDATTSANTRFFVNRSADGGTVGDSYSITRSAGVSYTITSKSAGSTQTADTSTVAILKIEP